MPDFDLDAALTPGSLREFSCPDGLSDVGQAAWQTIVDLLREHDDLKSGGHTKVFYSPAEWSARGEEHGEESGQGAELVVVHDGGNHACYFNGSYGCRSSVTAKDAALRLVGCFCEPCSSWYSAVYKL